MLRKMFLAATAVLLLELAPGALATQTSVEVHWDTLASGSFKRAGDFPSDFGLGDRGNGTWQLLPGSSPELGFVKFAGSASGGVEVHLDTLSGGAYRRAGDFTSDFSPADAGNGSFQLFGSASGAPELGFIKVRGSGSGTVEVHWDVLSGGTYRRAGDYRSDFNPADLANGKFELLPTANGVPELGFVKVFNTGSASVEVHLDALSGGAYRRVGDFRSDFSPADAGNGAWRLIPTGGGAPELGFVKLLHTARTVEAHWDTLSGGIYRRAGDYASDFSPADAGNGIWELLPSSGIAPELGFLKLGPPPATPPPPPQVLPSPHSVSEPITIVIPVRHARRHVRVRITISWTWNGNRTRLRRIHVGRLPRGGRIVVLCRGHGCPMPRGRAARAHHVRHMLIALDGLTYRAGDRLLITVTAPGLIAERAEIRIRSGALPKVRAL